MKPPITMTPKPGKGIPFHCSMKGVPYSNLGNIAIALEHDPDLQGRVWYDEFLQRLFTGQPPREWLDADDTEVATYLQNRRGLRSVSKYQVHDAINAYGRQHTRNIVRDWFATLTWDGEPRIAEAFVDHWGAEPSPAQTHDYLRVVSTNFFVGLIARVMRPGCQLDEMVVFESAQGRGKTSALRILGGEWYAATHEQVTRKDFFQDLEGKWIIEISELSAFSRAEVERIKHVISTPIDRYRGSYDHRSSDHRRQCIFAGTTNSERWGTDETGLRRFWPVSCGVINRLSLDRARDQLIAEALVRFKQDASWWEVPDGAAEVQADRQQEDPWTDVIQAALTLRSEITMNQTLTDVLRLPTRDQTLAMAHRAGRVLTLLGWKSTNVRDEAKQQRRIWKPL